MAVETITSPLERAKTIAKTYIDAFQPFSYDDIGLKFHRWYRRAFRAWAEANNVEFRRTRKSGRGGSQDALFYPFRIDENGIKQWAETPKKDR